uniref:Lanosterol 14-alpha demethylase n=1 Tax=Phasianus colchicus TaxID=9054 RepID=A0A669QPX8_PHACC
MLSSSLKLFLGPSLALRDCSLTFLICTACCFLSLSWTFFNFLTAALPYCPCLERRHSPFVPKSQARGQRQQDCGAALHRSDGPSRPSAHSTRHIPAAARTAAGAAHSPQPRAPPAPVFSGTAPAPAPPRRPPNGARRSPADAVTPWCAAAHWPGRRQSSHGQRSAQRRGWAGRLQGTPPRRAVAVRGSRSRSVPAEREAMLSLLEVGGSLLERAAVGNPLSLLLAASAFALSLGYLFQLGYRRHVGAGRTNHPPHIPSSIPFLGHAVAFGKNPIEFLENAYDKYGPVFSFTMVGKTFTYLLGSDAAALLFNSKNEDLNAEDVYSRLTTPVFGKGVAYDVPNAVFLEQKKMLKTGLNIAQFKQHVTLIEEETKEYFKAWGERGERNLFEAFSELIILTASHCLHGKEIRSLLNEKVAQLYADLDGGFTHAAWLLPAWLPLPSFRRRDRAHREIKNIFYKVIQKRRSSGEKEDDMLQTLLDASYKDGRPLTDDEIAGMLIGLLLAGQHTSSTTSAWLGFFIARDKAIQEQCYAEQKAVCGDDLPPLTYEQLKDLSLLDRCLKETLRLRPPIMTMMRLAKTPQTVAGYNIPPGHQDNPAAGEKFAYIPFGAGRHRCIGENFAYVQIKTIWSTLLRLYEFDLINDYFPSINYTTMIHTPNNPVIRYKRRSL